MESKSLIWLCLAVGSTVGSIVGSVLDGGNFLGTWSIIVGAVGGLLGIWIGFRLNNS